MRHFRSEFHLPIKSTQGVGCRERECLPQRTTPARIPFREIVRWLRIHLRGRRHVNIDALKIHVQRLTESEWLAAVAEPPIAGRHFGGKGIDLATIPDPRADFSETVYLRQLLATIERNLMSDDVPYFRALLDKTTAKDMAIALNANPSTTSKRMKQVRIKVQSIIIALNPGIRRNIC